MDELNRLLTDNLALALAVLGGLVILLLILVLVQSIRLGRAVRDYRALVGDGGGGSLGDVLERHIGLVRYNPFEDTGSDQSFAIALLDGERDGIVISSLHGRANTRVFAKPVQGGASPHALSAEEEQAIRIAVSGTGQTSNG